MQFHTATTPLSLTTPTQDRLLAEITGRLEENRGFALATLNLDHLVKLQKDRSFANAYAEHDMIVADGNPIVWLHRLAGQDISLLPGSDLILPIAALAAAKQAPIALLGSTQETLEAAAASLKKTVPNLRVSCVISPPMGFNPESDQAVDCINEISRSGARICFLALGAPKQEILASLGFKHSPNVGFVSIGAGLDFIAGTQSRAPAIIRKLALEWLWRMLSNPKRLTLRYAQCLAILPGLIFSALRQRR